jgi:uncharacterized protein HemY
MSNAEGSHGAAPTLPNQARAPSNRFWAVVMLVGIVASASTVAMIRRSAPNPEQLRLIATDAASAGLWAEAEDALARIKNRTDADRILQAFVANEQKNYEAASQYLDQVTSDGPDAARVALLRGRIELGRFHARRSEEGLLRAVRLDPKLVEARRLLVYLYGLQSRRHELLEQFSALSEQNALNLESIRHWCIAHQDIIQEPAALRADLEQFVAHDPSDRASKLGLANVYRQLRLFREAAEAVSDLSDSDPDVRATRAEIEFDRGDLPAAARILEGGPQDHPRLARLRGRLASSRLEWPLAVQCFRIAEAAEPNHAETVYGLSRALRFAGDPAAAEPYTRRGAAIRTLRESLEPGKYLDPQLACVKLAAICEAAGYFPEARACYRIIISVDPLNDEAQRAVFRLSAQKPQGVSAAKGQSPQ